MLFALFALLALNGCDKAGDGRAAATAPTRAGEVWTIDRAADRAAAPAALLAYVSGLHVMVLDGDDAYAGMTRLRAQSGANGARVFKLAGGGEATLTAAGDALDLRFASGESIPLRRLDLASK
jgi:hypothetical protein